jgi:hypothetical protein
VPADRPTEEPAPATQPPPSDQGADEEAARVWEGLTLHSRVALGEADHGLFGCARDMPPALWVYRCGCGGLCDSAEPCPMGESWSLTELGKRVAAYGRSQGAR